MLFAGIYYSTLDKTLISHYKVLAKKLSYLLWQIFFMVNSKYINNDILKVLIIDDERDICYLLSTLLKQKNLETDYVNSLTDAALALKKDIPEIVFLDNHLPDGLGLNFIEYIKNHYPSIKIVMITAHDTADDRQRALKEGVDYFIGKPFTRDMIYKTVEQLTN